MAYTYGINYTTTPKINVGPSTYTPAPTNSAVSSIVNSLSSLLKPQQAFSTTLPYETYAAPQREALKWWEQNVYRPEYEKFTLNPFQRSQANQAAVGGMFAQANRPRNYQNELSQLTKQYYSDPLQNAVGSYEDMIRSAYNQQLQNYYNSPTAFNNIGA